MFYAFELHPRHFARIHRIHFIHRHSERIRIAMFSNHTHCYLFVPHVSLLQDHHDDIRQEQKWEMQALSSSQTSSSNSSPDESIEHNGNGLAECEPGVTTESSSSCGSHVDNVSSQHINNNTIAINNNNCDTIKNNNQAVTAAAAAPLDMVNDVEAVPAVALIEQQSTLLRGVNIGMRVCSFSRNNEILCALIIMKFIFLL
jgi:hypothetical protein